MAYENVEIAYKNLCLSPRSTSEFGYIDHTAGANGEFRIVDGSIGGGGSVLQTYTLSAGVSEIKSLEYVGPRNVGLAFNQLGDELPFFTLERVSSTECEIKYWKLNSTGNTFDLQSTITMTDSGANYFDCNAMAVENYETSFKSATTSGTGQISLASIGKVEVGDALLLGPSSDVSPPGNQFSLEYVIVTGVAGSIAYINSSDPQHEYAGGDPITYWKDIYLFSDIGQNNDSTKGALYTIDPSNGTVSGVHNDGIYNSVIAASWSRYYQNIGFVKNANILYLDYTDYEIKKSHLMTNTKANETALWTVYDIIFEGAPIYRLQEGTTRADTNGTKSDTSWAGLGPYNYQLDTAAFYTKSLSVHGEPDNVVKSDLDSIDLYVLVKDQYGVPLSSKNVYFFDNPDYGDFTTTFVTTDVNGVAFITYDVIDFGSSWPPTAPSESDDLSITIRTNGGVAGITGHDNVWDGVDLLAHKSFKVDIYLDQIPAIGDEAPGGFGLLDQVSSGVESVMYMKGLSKFQFPGGHWTSAGAPIDGTTIVEQLGDFNSTVEFDQIGSDLSTDVYIDQDKDQSNDTFISQLYISRHASSGHQDTVSVEQFRFVDLFDPDMFSEKNSVTTNIRVRLLPFGYSLNQSTLVFKVKEVSYAGNTGYVDVTPLLSITTFDAGGGLLGLDMTYNPVNDFHHNAVVYVSIEVYDVAPVPNVLLVDYWFKIIPDFRAPYITNENPAREKENVSVATNVSFDILDAGVGVDISSLEFYANNRAVTPVTVTTASGYSVSYNPPSDFHYGQTVELTVKVSDASDAQNQLYDTWRFFCAGSTGPWIDPDSFYPRNCTRGTYRKLIGISANVYAVDDTGLDKGSIMVTIGGKDRNVTITPIIYRID
ncbi:hypothetical protein LCGC14_1239750 [marine sediment metagenome]|uniref:Uncharacterized protein n=1 Tax=marine sediment metagenome TaxID=412755 RepID=A0A0F9NND9_9ZZZZ